MAKLKLLGICTSARGRDSNTYYLMKKAFDALIDPDVEREIIVASELKLRPCDHHYSVDSKMCVHPCLITQIDKEDEMSKIYDGIISADIVIFSTPIYWGNHSQLMQLIIERLNSLENANSVHGTVVVKNKIGGLMILGHEDGYQHVAGGLMNFLSAMGVIFPPQAYAAWVGESDEDTRADKGRIEGDVAISDAFADLVGNAVGFARAILTCPDCGHKLNYEHRSKKKNYIDISKKT
ncbi:MAG: flavodoxin family protein [Candidatus Colwellbacteria bacterium]|nr:flavodoxin family protein [Candidatus Colwellbacteria bacterium]